MRKSIFFIILICLTFNSCEFLDKNTKSSKQDLTSLDATIDNSKQDVSASPDNTKIGVSISPEETKDKIKVDELNKLYDKAYNDFHGRKYKAAIKTTDKIIKIDESYFKAYNIKGIALVFSDNFEEGIKNIDKSLQLEPNDWYCRFNKALAFSYKQRFEEAIIWYDLSLEEKNYVWSHYGKAAVYGQLNDVENAIENLKIAIKMKDNIKIIAKGEKDFNDIRNDKRFKEIIE